MGTAPGWGRGRAPSRVVLGGGWGLPALRGARGGRERRPRRSPTALRSPWWWSRGRAPCFSSKHKLPGEPPRGLCTTTSTTSSRGKPGSGRHEQVSYCQVTSRKLPS